ncbi:dimethylarginine dimethylaminohydrolase family protein [Chloroflexota bacterium]
MFTHAITRKPGPNYAQGITTSDSVTANFTKALEQHQAYVETLITIGLEVVILDPLPDYPDSYFVEDAAVITQNVAVITRPGAMARRGEASAIAPVLAEYRQTAIIQAPGTLDGGDVLMVGKHFFIGISDRTNAEGADQLGLILEQHGYTWTGIQVSGGLHLKSGVNSVGGDTLLLTQEFSTLDEFKSFEVIIVDEIESYAANTLWINNYLIMPTGFQKTRHKLEKLNLPIIELEVSEACKMDGGLTCMSLRF